MHPSLIRFLPSNPTYSYDEGRTSYLGTDIREAGPDPFVYCGESMAKQYFDASCQSDDVVLRASYDSVNGGVSAKGSETNGNRSKEEFVHAVKTLP